MDRRFNWGVVVGAALIAAAVGVMSYNAGVSHGLALNVAVAGERTIAVVPYVWHGPWGFGFFGPFAFIFFWFLALRLFWWGGGHRRRWYYQGAYDVPPPFEEWHRRAHERMKEKES